MSAELINSIKVMNTGEGNGMYGKNHTDATKIKMSMAKRGKTLKKVICPHCGLEGGGPNMTRYHFENCKYKGNKNECIKFKS